MLDEHDASHDRLRLAVHRALSTYSEPELFDCLGDPDRVVRTTAGRVLHIRGGQSAFAYAASLAGHSRYEMREVAAFVLGQLGTPACPYAEAAYRVLYELLRDPYSEVRSAAAAAVGSMASLGHQPPGSISARVADLAGDDNAEVRNSVAFALGMSHGLESLKRLMMMREDDDARVRETAELGIDLHDHRGAGRAKRVPRQSMEAAD